MGGVESLPGGRNGVSGIGGQEPLGSPFFIFYFIWQVMVTVNAFLLVSDVLSTVLAVFGARYWKYSVVLRCSQSLCVSLVECQVLKATPAL